MKNRIKWNAKKHDKDTAEKLMEDLRQKAEAQKVQVVKAINRRWKVFLKSDGPKCKSDHELISKLQNCRDDIVEMARKNGLKEWAAATLELINSKITQLTTKGTVPFNMLVELKENPRMAEIRTYADILMVQWIKPITEKKGFVGIVRDNSILYAYFEDGELVELCRCVNTIGTQNIPTKGELTKVIQMERAASPSQN